MTSWTPSNTVTCPDTITKVEWAALRVRAWKYQMGNRPPAGFKIVHRLDKAHTN